VEECVAGLREVQAAGAGMVLLNFVGDELANAERAARDLIPALR
jgi:hypothetical protein